MNKIVSWSIVAVIVILLLGALLVPTINNYTSPESDVENVTVNATAHYSNEHAYGDSAPIPYMYSTTQATTIQITTDSITANGTAIHPASYSRCYLVSAAAYIFENYADGARTNFQISCEAGYLTIAASGDNAQTSATLTYTGTQLTITFGSNTYTYSCPEIWLASDTATDFCLMDSAATTYTHLTSSDVILCAQLLTTGWTAIRNGTLTFNGSELSEWSYKLHSFTNVGNQMVSSTGGYDIYKGTESYQLTFNPIVHATIDVEYTYTNTQTKSWHVDDFKIVNDVKSVSGNLETVTISNIQFIHATGVGTGTITYNDDSTATVSITKGQLDVILALGQSNNAYYAVDEFKATTPSIATGYYFGTASRPLTGENTADVASGEFLSISNYPNSTLIGDKAPAFIKEYYAKTGIKPYYINGSYGGSSISTWQSGQSSFEDAKTIIAAAIAKIPDYFEVNYTGYTWIQGEADQAQTQEWYVEQFKTMNESILSDGLGVTVDHAFLSKLGSEWTTVNAAQATIVDEVPTASIGSTIAPSFTTENGLMSSDGVHYSQAGDDLVGKQLAASMADFYHPTPIDGSKGMNLLSAIPLILIAALIIGMVGDLVIRRSDD